MKLELKHLSPYLPYGLKMNFNRNGGMFTASNVNILKTDVCFSEFMNESYLKYDNVTYGMHDIKPILRPLSDLTKKIQIAEYFCEFQYHFERMNPALMTVHNSAVMNGGIVELQYYRDYELLFKWHFDVFGLIEAGLAIDKNTLEPCH